MSRHRSPRIAHRHDALLQRVQALNAEHPFWGYRRIWADLRFVEPWPVHKKRVWRLMREHHLLVPPNLKLQAKRTPTGSQPRATKPNEWGGLEMTKLVVEGFGWVSIVVVVDWYTQQIVGYDVGQSCPSTHGLAALDMAVNRQCPNGARGQDISLMSDHGCQPTALALMQACHTLGIHQAFTSDNNPKGKADTERMRRTRKEECRWLTEWKSPSALSRALEAWIDYDNEHYLPSSLGYKTPRQFEREYHQSHSTPFVAA